MRGCSSSAVFHTSFNLTLFPIDGCSNPDHHLCRSTIYNDHALQLKAPLTCVGVSAGVITSGAPANKPRTQTNNTNNTNNKQLKNSQTTNKYKTAKQQTSTKQPNHRECTGKTHLSSMPPSVDAIPVPEHVSACCGGRPSKLR